MWWFNFFEIAQSPHENNMSEAHTKSVLVRFCNNSWKKGNDFLRLCRIKKHVGEGGERERALDDTFGI